MREEYIYISRCSVGDIPLFWFARRREDAKKLRSPARHRFLSSYIETRTAAHLKALRAMETPPLRVFASSCEPNLRRRVFRLTADGSERRKTDTDLRRSIFGLPPFCHLREGGDPWSDSDSHTTIAG
jgi:hypothetical protein